MQLVGICGAAGAGKDTVADRICQHHKFTKYSFAHPIKEACKQIFGWDERHLFGELKEVIDPQYGVSPRQALQTLGTEWGRKLINEDIWTQAAEVKFWNLKEGSISKIISGLVIPDVRFENEAQMIRRNGGLLIHVQRDSAPKIRDHPSEDGVVFVKGDVHIDNSGDLESLFNHVDYLFKNGVAA